MFNANLSLQNNTQSKCTHGRWMARLPRVMGVVWLGAMLLAGAVQAQNINTAAGSGMLGPEGVPATSVFISSPRATAVDSTGNLYIADLNNNRIRKVTPGGTISTVAGNGTYGFSGDSGAATTAQLNYPTGVAVDSTGNL